MSKKFLTPIVPPSLEIDPETSTVGAMYYNVNQEALKFFNGEKWFTMASIDDLSTKFVNHTHDEAGFVKDVYQYDGNGVIPPKSFDSWSTLDGGDPTSGFLQTIDGGTVA